jgi:hypothetical protein
MDAKKIIVINGYPLEEELRNRILRQLEWRSSSEAVALVHQHVSFET